MFEVFINCQQMYLFKEIKIEFLKNQLEKYYICTLNICYDLYRTC